MTAMDHIQLAATERLISGIDWDNSTRWLDLMNTELSRCHDVLQAAPKAERDTHVILPYMQSLRDLSTIIGYRRYELLRK